MYNITHGAPSLDTINWLNRNPSMAQGFVDYYDGKPFDYNANMFYEFGRQMAVLSKLDGLRRSDLVRKRPKKDVYAFTKTKVVELDRLADAAGLFGDFSTTTD